MVGVVGLVVVACLVGLGMGIAPCPRPQDKGQCSSVKLLLGATNEINLSVLRQMCVQGHHHVVDTPVPRRATTIASTKRVRQFAVLNLHRDSFSDAMSWTSGGAEAVVCANDWQVDDSVQLTNGYRWYRHGLPMWPLLNQTIGFKKRPLIRKKLDWPNYAFATPLYLVQHEMTNYRDPLIAVSKLFSGDVIAQQIDAKPLDKFIKPDKLQAEVVQLVTELGNDIYTNPEDYKNWLLPLVKRSLGPMTESFIARQKSQGSKVSPLSRCPDLLYIFFLRKPCSTANACPLLNEVQLAVRKASCTSTNLVVGYSEAT